MALPLLPIAILAGGIYLLLKELEGGEDIEKGNEVQRDCSSGNRGGKQHSTVEKQHRNGGIAKFPVKPKKKGEKDDKGKYDSVPGSTGNDCTGEQHGTGGLRQGGGIDEKIPADDGGNNGNDVSVKQGSGDESHRQEDTQGSAVDSDRDQ